jgi:ornithine cyclodeaminase/alanine dehydrogenase-like protein (mu-crystallin family)
LDTPEPLLISRRELASLMDLDAYYRAAESAFLAHAQGRATVPMPLHIAVDGGGFHATGAFIDAGPEERFAAVKVNSNFPGNPSRGLPTIQGAVLLYDAADGRLLAILDSIEITSRRTAAAGAVAARHLARGDSSTIGICGCGEQGRAQLAAIARVLPIRRAWAWDADAARAGRFAQEMSRSLGLDVAAVREIAGADVIVTATSALEPFLRTVAPGTFIAAIGAESPHKSEIHPALMASSKVVTDLTSQAIAMGDLHHAPGAAVHAELGEIVAGRRPGRESDDEVIVFDSTGVAIQDVAAAACAYQRAVGARDICRA